jgi:proteic killer suppression protein
MIRSFKSRALHVYWRSGDASGIRADHVERIRRRLDALDAASRPGDMNIPGFNFHRLRGKPIRYRVHINGPWCLTYEWDGEDAVRVNLEQYH